jgi:predicted component of type VI protein secretion system
MSDLILEIVEGPGAGRQVGLDGVLDVGRDASMGLALENDGQVSRRHARFSLQGGAAIVEDAGSTNGTYVNDQLIATPRPLRPGDKVRLGLTVLELRTRQQVAARPSAVHPRPALTAIDNDVLRPVPEDELARVADVPPEGPIAAAPPPFRMPESPAAYVPAEVMGDPQAEGDYGTISRWVDSEVRRQRNVAAIAMLSASALAVIVYFGLS